MIQSKDNFEATNYSHQCSDIFVKLSNLKSKNSRTETKSTNSLSPSTQDRLDKRANCESNNKSNDVSSDQLLVNQKLNDKKTNDKKTSDKKLNDKKLDDNQPISKQSNSKLGNKSNDLNDKLNDNSNKKSIDSIGKLNLKSIDKLSNLKNKSDEKLVDIVKKECLRIESKKKESLKKCCANKDIPTNNRKRSDIENIFDLNSIKRVRADMSNSRRPLVFCGPSGSGKSSLLKKLRSDFPDYFGFSISHTTRQPRAGEVHGQDYYYVTREEMLKAIENDEFIETAEFSGNIYGTSKKAVEDVRSKGKICILDIEIEGVKNVKKSHLNPVYIFIKPPNIDELENRLRRRGSETEENLQKRLLRAADEIAFGDVNGNFDLLLVNDDFKSTYDKLKSFVLESYDLPDTSNKKPETN